MFWLPNNKIDTLLIRTTVKDIKLQPPSPLTDQFYAATNNFLLSVDILCTDFNVFNPLNAELNPIRHLLALAGAHHFVHVSRIRANNQSKFLYVLY
jgi:hypothetical protein